MKTVKEHRALVIKDSNDMAIAIYNNYSPQFKVVIGGVEKSFSSLKEAQEAASKGR